MLSALHIARPLITIIALYKMISLWPAGLEFDTYDVNDKPPFVLVISNDLKYL